MKISFPAYTTRPGEPDVYVPNWKDHAKAQAKIAHQDKFVSRRGVVYLPDLKILCVYNNYPDSKGWNHRDEETKEFRKKLKEAGIKELAYATHGGREQPDYTYAMLLEAGEDRQQWVVDTLQEIVNNTLSRLADQQ